MCVHPTTLIYWSLEDFTNMAEIESYKPTLHYTYFFCLIGCKLTRILVLEKRFMLLTDRQTDSANQTSVGLRRAAGGATLFMPSHNFVMAGYFIAQFMAIGI